MAERAQETPCVGPYVLHNVLGKGQTGECKPFSHQLSFIDLFIILSFFILFLSQLFINSFTQVDSADDNLEFQWEEGLNFLFGFVRQILFVLCLQKKSADIR